MNTITVTELAQWLKSESDDQPVLLDVREPWEVEIASLPDSLCIPMGQIPERSGEIPDNQPIVCICHHGVRSLQVAVFLSRDKQSDIINLTGGIDAWSRQVDSACATY